MFRKYLFLALTAMLVSVLVYLGIRSRGIEKRVSSERAVEVVRTSRPTATRAIAPEDLAAGLCTLKDGAVEVQLRNTGRSSYKNVTLKVSFAGKRQAVERNELVPDTIVPGAPVTAALGPQDLPPGVTGCAARVLYADVVPK